jgi:hypothetical protein
VVHCFPNSAHLRESCANFDKAGDMQRRLSGRLWVELALAVVSASLTVLTLAWSAWIEGLFGVNPDAGSGSSEWGISLAFVVATVALAALAGRTWRRDRRNISVSGSLGLRLSDGADNLP